MVRERKPPSNGTQGEAAVPLDPAALAHRFSATVSSTLEAVGESTDKVMEVARSAGCGKGDMTDLEIALREALVNAVVHGNENDPGKRVSLQCYCDPDHGILLVIRDEGKGFDPDTVPDPTQAERVYLHHGRGIYMMRELMDHVEHRDGGREIVLYKKCPSDANGKPDDSETES